MLEKVSQVSRRINYRQTSKEQWEIIDTRLNDSILAHVTLVRGEQFIRFSDYGLFTPELREIAEFMEELDEEVKDERSRTCKIT